MNNNVIILAGGLGKRMNSNLPKVLHLLNDKPLLIYVIETALKINPEKILIVVGKYGELIKKTINKYITLENIVYINQEIPLGTGHAVLCCSNYLKDYENSLITILSGDVPLISSNTIKNLIKEKKDSEGIILINKMENPFGYGRIKCDNNNNFIKIIEHKDCLQEELDINMVNTGIYVFSCKTLLDNISKIGNNNSQNEFYLTDIFQFINSKKIKLYLNENNFEIKGINTIEELNEMKNYLDNLSSINIGQ